jgi:NAD(P)H-flavin reductase
MQPKEPRLTRAELVAVAPLSPRVRWLALTARGPDPLEWEPGQYIELSLSGDPRRVPLSVASAPDPDELGYFELAVTVGAGGGMFDDLAVGAVLDVFGPQGRFIWAGEDVPEIFIGAGTGLAPLRAMIQAALGCGGSAPLLLLAGARAESDILWREEMQELALEHPRLRFEATLTQPMNGWTGRRGRVQDHFAELVAPQADARVYVCGARDMVDECVRELTERHGFPRERVLSESV